MWTQGRDAPCGSKGYLSDCEKGGIFYENMETALDNDVYPGGAGLHLGDDGVGYEYSLDW